MVLWLLLSGCGFVPTESKLVGTWQVDLPPPQKIVFTFQKDHTYAMGITGSAGAAQGTWTLNGNILKTTLRSFAAMGMTNALPAVPGLMNEKYTVVRLTGSTMVWGKGIGTSTITLKRLAPSPPGPQSSP